MATLTDGPGSPTIMRLWGTPAMTPMSDGARQGYFVFGITPCDPTMAAALYSPRSRPLRVELATCRGPAAADALVREGLGVRTCFPRPRFADCDAGDLPQRVMSVGEGLGVRTCSPRPRTGEGLGVRVYGDD